MKLKNILLFSSFLFLVLYIPLFIMIYSNSFYELNYIYLDTYSNINVSEVNNATNNLINYFIYNGDLNELWSINEKNHMRDVRKIYSLLFILAIFSLFIFKFNYDKKLICKYSKINIKIILLLILIIPFFNYFWDNIFHKLLFFNNFWVFYFSDISFYLFPYSFFKNSLIFLIIFSIIENLIIFYFLNKY